VFKKHTIQCGLTALDTIHKQLHSGIKTVHVIHVTTITNHYIGYKITESHMMTNRSKYKTNNIIFETLCNNFNCIGNFTFSISSFIKTKF